MVLTSVASRKLVLVVEDEDIVREIVCMELGDAGFNVLDAGTADEALGLLLRHASAGNDICILFTDIRMPGSLDGWDLAERARSLVPGLGVVYASGNEPALHRAVPGSIFLPKPYRTVDLLKSLSRLQVNQPNSAHPTCVPGQARL